MPQSHPRLGAHMSIAGGVDKSIERGRRVGCEAIQIFTKSSNQWKARPLAEDEIARFQAARTELDIHPVVAHDSYLINLGTPDDALWRKSLDAITPRGRTLRSLSASLAW